MDRVDARKYPAIISLRLPAEKAAELRRRAEADDRAPSWLARRLILRGLEEPTGTGSHPVGEPA